LQFFPSATLGDNKAAFIKTLSTRKNTFFINVGIKVIDEAFVLRFFWFSRGGRQQPG